VQARAWPFRAYLFALFALHEYFGGFIALSSSSASKLSRGV
jgi:hypothetical protein